MKIKPEHYDHMKTAMQPFADRIAAHRQFIIEEGKAKDVEKRLRWDIHYAAKLSPWICEHVYPYANDVHIDTALRAIMKEIEARD